MPEYKLQYFPITGLGEPIRMSFGMAGVPFEDQHVPGAEWGALKGAAPYGQMPVLFVDGNPMAQARAILRYLGTQLDGPDGKLYPEDSMQAYQCDEFMDLIDDARSTFLSTFSIADQAEKEAARAALVAEGGKMRTVIEKIEARLGRTEGTAVPGRITIADIYGTCTLWDFQQPTFLDGFPDDTYAACPNINAMKARVCAVPNVAAYYADKDGIRAPFKSA